MICLRITLLFIDADFSPSFPETTISGHKNWENTISDDRNTIYQRYIGNDPNLQDVDDRRDDTKDRLVFGWTRNALGEYAYRFLGKYRVTGSHGGITTMERIDTKCVLSDYRNK